MALNRRGAMHRGSCTGELLAVTRGHGGARGRVWGVCGGGPQPGEGREGAGGARGAARVSTLYGALGRRSVRTRGKPERKREEGPDSVACYGRRGALSGALGRPEVAGVVGQRGATVRECTVACSRAPKWPAWPFSMQCGCPRACPSGLGRSKERGRGFGCPGWRLE